jgi:hypothetical protein
VLSSSRWRGSAAPGRKVDPSLLPAGPGYASAGQQCRGLAGVPNHAGHQNTLGSLLTFVARSLGGLRGGGDLEALHREAPRLDVQRKRDGVIIDEVSFSYEQAVRRFRSFRSPTSSANRDRAIDAEGRSEEAGASPPVVSLTGLRTLIELGLVEVRPAANDNHAALLIPNLP